MRIITEESANKKLSEDVLNIAMEAKRQKELNPKVINATIGMLYDEDGVLKEFQSIKKIMNNLTYDEKYSYSSSKGGEDFKEGIAKLVFRNKYDFITKNYFYDVTATPGGSGAVYNTISNYLEQGQYLLTSDLGWKVYNNMANEKNRYVVNYKLFDNDGNFNLKEFKLKLKEQIDFQKRSLIIINDPCHNPTGYSLSIEEWKEIKDYLNSFNEPIVLLVDLAYIDFSHLGLNGSRDFMDILLELNNNILTLFAFSGSKSFSLYGLRIGALLALSKDKAAIDDFMFASEYTARGIWSNTNHSGISLVSKLGKDDVLLSEYTKELVETSNLLNQRSNIFIKEANEVGLKYYPYKSGFFVTIPCNGIKVFESLKKVDIHVVPFKDAIRVSLSAISINETKGLARIIKNHIDIA